MTEPLDLGCFSMSLNVADLEASLAFYDALGFSAIGGEDRWRILANGRTKIGLFEGEIDTNILTFNPGWDNNGNELDTYTDIRDLQRQLKAQGVELLTEADETSTGPASFVAVDPDGNPILVDQHV